MPRLLYVSTSSTLGGAEKTVYTLATQMAHRKFDIAGFVSLKPKGYYADKLEKEGYPVFTLNLTGVPGWGTIQELRRIITQMQPDIVHASMYQAIQLARSVKKLGPSNFKLLSSPRVHYRTRSLPTLWLDRALKSADDLLVAECDASRDYLTQRLGYAADKIVTIHNGIDMSAWPPIGGNGGASRSKRHELCVKLPMRHTDILIGTAGRLDEQKGHLYLLEAVAKLQVIHPVQCVILGDGPMRKSLVRWMRELKLEERVHLVGEQSDIAPWLGALDIFVLPSLWEGFPNALMEAMALGLPIAATRVDGVPELVDSGVDGLLCEPKDSQALFTAIQDLIVHPDLRKRLGAAARQKISSRFTLSNMISAYETAYLRLTG